MSFNTHLIISTVIRLFLINYGEIQDSISEVPYTDVDYRVVTDGARHVLQGKSPFKRHTFRYTPILAYLLLPNHWIHNCFGKVLFSCFDIIIGVLIKKIVCEEFLHTRTVVDNKLTIAEKLNKKYIRRRQSELKSNQLPSRFIQVAEYCAYLWLYNPLPMVIATRGNGDSVSCALVLAALYYMLKQEKPDFNQYFTAGLFLGTAIHFRLYPIGFTFACFLTLSSRNTIDNYKDLTNVFLQINRKQLSLIFGTITSFIILTSAMTAFYGFDYLYESILYHLVRKDTRHNFSLFFYLQYLGSEYTITAAEKVLTLLPQLITVFLISIKYGTNRETLPFCLFTIAFLMVTYNSVVTSQYFVWFLSLIPVCAKNLQGLGLKRAIFLPIVWFLAQGGWLLPAYLLEFKGWNTFDFIFLQGSVFFVANIIILYTIIATYDVSFNYKLN
uniref:GPI alpha-1,4-mannosyltransferase I, catalytic subunit n=1 Tax=Culicoides sonorensis TaxID=179676 RepID=A0A336N8Y0_CULSO